MYTGNLINNISKSTKETIRFSKGNKFGDSNSPFYHPHLINKEATDKAEIDLYKSFYPTAPAKVNLYLPDENIENYLVASYGGFKGADNGKGTLFARSDGTTFSFIEDPIRNKQLLVADGVLTRDITVNGFAYKAGDPLPHMIDLTPLGFQGMKMVYTVALYAYVKEMLDNGVFWLASFISHNLVDGENAAKSLVFINGMMSRFHKSLFEFPVTIGKRHENKKIPTGGKKEFSYWDIKPMSVIGQQILPQKSQLLPETKPSAVEALEPVSEDIDVPSPAAANEIKNENVQKAATVKMLETLTREEIESLLAPLNTDIPDHLCSRDVIANNWPELLDMSSDYLADCVKKADAFFLDLKNNPEKFQGQEKKIRSAGAKREAYISAYLIAVQQE